MPYPSRRAEERPDGEFCQYQVTTMSLEPQNAAEVRRIVEERLNALESAGSVPETVTIDWRGGQRSVPVITMPVELLSYNPSSHRIRAQRSIKPDLEREVERDPFSAKSQDYLAELLKCDPTDPNKIDPSYVALKEDLKTHGQSEPGIITRFGMLVNGNTRQAALKELAHKHIRVGVLPPDTSIDDIQAIELALQLRKDHKRDYSFMNLLLAIDERRGKQLAADIQREFRIRSNTYDRCCWILDFVRDAIKRSSVEIDGSIFSLSLADFEAHQGKLEELHRGYQALKKKAPDDAEAFRELRLLALALGKSKTDLRLIEADFSKRFMPNVVPPSKEKPAAKIPGLDIEVPGTSPEVEALKAFATQHLRAKAIVANHSRTSKAHAEKASELLKATDEALDKGLDHAGRQARLIKKRLAAVDWVSDACDKLQSAVAAVAEARASNTFEPTDIDDALLTLKAQIMKLSVIVTRGSDSNSEGILWIKSVGQMDAHKG
jgi:hypothetical protein